MLLRQITHDDLGCASYLIGDERAGISAVVDPGIDVDRYVDVARRLGVQIRHVLETHNHADHVSGHGALARITDSTIHIHRVADVEFDHEPIDDGWLLELGDLVVRALPLPGHRPEHTGFLLAHRLRLDEPWAVLTGDALLIGDVARPDLAVEPTEGARQLHRSLREQLLPLADHVEVWPGHLGGSLCASSSRVEARSCSTVGHERRHNSLFGENDEDCFVARTLAGLGPHPPNVEQIVALNRGPLTDNRRALPALDAQAFRERVATGAMVVDVRDDEAFAAAHVPGAISVPAAGPMFATRLSRVVGPDQTLLIVGRDSAEAEHAAHLALATGLIHQDGYLKDGQSAWAAHRYPVEEVEQVPAHELSGLIDSDPAIQIVDVRELSEWATGHVPGSLCAPLHQLGTAPNDLDIDLGRPVAVICGSGQRAATGASLLRRLGAERVIHVAPGGVATWAEAGGRLESAEASND